MAYATLADLKSYLGIETADDDAILQQLLGAAQALIDRWCRRIFEADEDSARTFDADDVAGDLLLFGADLCAVTSVVEGDSTLTRGTDYLTRPRHDDDAPWWGLKRIGTTWSADDDIVIMGRWAYATSAPADIEQATKRLAAYLYRQKDNAGGDLDRTIIAGNTTILPAAWPADVERMLRPFRRVTA